MLFEHSPRVVYITTRDGRVIDANPAFFRMFGVSRDELDTWNVISVYADPADRMRLRDAVERDGQVDDFFVNLRDGEGRIRECSITSTVWKNDDGEILGYQGIIRDVTEEHELERALRESVDRFNLLARATSDVIYDWNVSSNSLHWNEALYSLFHYRREDVAPNIEWWENRLHPADLPAVQRSIETTFASDSEYWSCEYRFRRGDGTYATVLDRGYIVRANDGKPQRMIGSMVDLTAQRLAEEQRRFLEEQLRQSQKMEAIGKLAGGIAHDFNNLLTAVRGHAELLLEGSTVHGETREGLEEIAKAADRAAALTRQLLAFSRRQVLQPRVVDVNRVVLDMKKMLARLIGEHIRLETVLDPTISCIKADPSQIEQVILNLVVNARDAMPEGGTLTIATSESKLTNVDRAKYSYVTPGDFVRISVRDTGIGMNRETLERAFEPFFTTKEAGKGTGLGLSTVYGIVKQSGGYIWAESQPGSGAEFRIFLPKESAKQEEEAAAVIPVKNAARAETILVVEDEGAVRSLVQRILNKRGYTVLTARDGVEAIKLVNATAHPIDLVITDVVMPGMGGSELVRHLTTLRPNLRVLYMSGYTEDEVVRHGVVDQMVWFLSKPFSSEGLTDKVRMLLDQPAQHPS
jgi:two-component system, cell cycle sensor histidine kinase and response regulator CckA